MLVELHVIIKLRVIIIWPLHEKLCCKWGRLISHLMILMIEIWLTYNYYTSGIPGQKLLVFILQLWINDLVWYSECSTEQFIIKGDILNSNFYWLKTRETTVFSMEDSLDLFLSYFPILFFAIGFIGNVLVIRIVHKTRQMHSQRITF